MTIVVPCSGVVIFHASQAARQTKSAKKSSAQDKDATQTMVLAFSQSV